ncbi:MAG TPA: type I-E CRISPR-associated protein Cas7/Cse4/CasC [Chloroflexota bacterium]|nr:type I-E CRISPR-associated protein Cas7/Cse4/CasC [Chloroflexota bacterium]
MFVESHILQNFAPSNLNRDDTGSPKDCDFGGYRRARISSQCLKRAIRTATRDGGLIDAAHLATRTRLLKKTLVDALVQRGQSEAEALAVVPSALRSVGLAVKDDGTTQYLLYLGTSEINAVADRCLEHWSTLLAASSSAEPSVDGGANDKPKRAKSTKKAGKEAVPTAVSDSLKRVLDGGKAADLALFGRMLADLPIKSIDAACQVAHALSTHRVSMEFDFYTAVDELQQNDTSGAGMMGTVEFNSACFYRYANVDLTQLLRNLEGDDDLARMSLSAFLRASVLAVPTGKQNSMAAQNPPSLVFTVVRDAGLWSLANAFAKPVRAEDAGGDIVAASVRALDSYWGKLTRMYGQSQLRGHWVCTLVDSELPNLAPVPDHRAETVDDLIARTLDAVSFAPANSRDR